MNEKEKLTLKTIKASEESINKNYRIVAALCGPSGSGKTQSAMTIPGKKLLIDYDGRWQTVAGQPDIEVISLYDPNPKSPSAWDNAEKLRQRIWAMVRAGDFDFSAVIEDGATAMGRYAMNWALLLDNKRGLGGAPAKQHYIPQMKAFADHILSMKALPCHYIITAHLELIEDEENGGIQYFPKVTGKTARSEFAGWFNETYWCQRHRGKEGELIYTWTTAGTGKMDFFKSSLNQLGKYWKDPVVIDFSNPPVGFARLLHWRFGTNTPPQAKEDSGKDNRSPDEQGSS